MERSLPLVPRMVIGVEPCFDFGLVVDDFASDFVVWEDVVVTEGLESVVVEVVSNG